MFLLILAALTSKGVREPTVRPRVFGRPGVRASGCRASGVQRGRRWACKRCTAPPPAPHAVYSRPDWRGGSRPRAAKPYACVRQVLPTVERCIPTGHCKNTLSHTISGKGWYASPDLSGREKGGGVRENAFPDECKAQAVRGQGRVHAMMDIVLISIWPLLPYCGGAGRHRSLHPRPNRCSGRDRVCHANWTDAFALRLRHVLAIREILRFGHCIR